MTGGMIVKWSSARACSTYDFNADRILVIDDFILVIGDFVLVMRDFVPVTRVFILVTGEFIRSHRRVHSRHR